VVHRRSDDGARKNLIIFVHGLGGSRYGTAATWGRFPQFVFEDFPEMDVGLYAYRSFLKRFVFWRSIDIPTEAEILGQCIRDGSYQRVILVGHSLGGVLCKAAICDLLKANSLAALARIGGLFLMASPQVGSNRVSAAFSWLSNDFQALKLHGKLITDITETFQNNIWPDEAIVGTGKVVIPTWAVLAASDFWVDRISAGINLTAARRLTVHGLHTEVVKPTGRENPVYTWVSARIRICLGRTHSETPGTFATQGPDPAPEPPILKPSPEPMIAPPRPDPLPAPTKNQIRRLASDIVDLIRYAHSAFKDPANATLPTDDLTPKLSGCIGVALIATIMANGGIGANWLRVMRMQNLSRGMLSKSYLSSKKLSLVSRTVANGKSRLI
jgi:pimeloyl-ACP methyl ester carboxylesterase